MSRFGPSFTAVNTRRLQRRGLRGATVTVVLTSGVVGLVGADGGDEAIPLARIDRLRAGIISGKGRQRPELLLYVQGEGAPLHFHPMRDPADAAAGQRSYPHFVRGVAAELAGQGRLAAIETGSGMIWAAMSVLLLALAAVAMAGIFASTILHPLPEEERWFAWGFTGIVAAGLLALAIWWWRRTWPRRVHRLADLDSVLVDP